MYSDKVMDHFEHPRNVGEIENASGVGTVGNAKCGDIMRIYLDIDDATHMIRDCKFKTFGCGAAVATSSMATEMVKGKTAIFISHRLSSTRFCDKIVMFEDGRIIEEGTHEQLIKANRKYRNMFQVQAQYYKDKEGEVC